MGYEWIGNDEFQNFRYESIVSMLDGLALTSKTDRFAQAEVEIASHKRDTDFIGFEPTRPFLTAGTTVIDALWYRHAEKSRPPLAGTIPTDCFVRFESSTAEPTHLYYAWAHSGDGFSSRQPLSSLGLSGLECPVLSRLYTEVKLLQMQPVDPNDPLIEEVLKAHPTTELWVAEHSFDLSTTADVEHSYPHWQLSFVFEAKQQSLLFLEQMKNY